MRKSGLAVALLLVAACSEEASQVTAPAQLNVSTSETKRWAIVFNAPNGLPRNVDRMIAEAGGTLGASMPEIGAAVALSSDPEFATRLSREPQVQGVTEDISIPMIPGGIENMAINLAEAGSPGPTEPAGPDPQPGTEPLYNQQWDKMRMNASATGSYAVQRGRREVVVGILDTGVEILPIPHPDIAPNLDIARSRSFVVAPGAPPAPANGDPNPAAWDDRNGHGSWCASAVAAPINAFGISGVAPEVTIVALRVLDDAGNGSYTAIAQALIYAGVNKFDVASMSLGGYLRHAAHFQPLVTMVQRAVQFARTNGVTPVAAMGNDNFNMSDGDFVRDALLVPGELAGVIGVSATTYSNTKAYYSNYGVGKVDVAAPGGGSTTFTPIPPFYYGFGRVVGAWASEARTSPNAMFQEEHCVPGPGGACFLYEWTRGTSMAAPNAAGVAALIISQYGDFTVDGSMKPHMSPTAVESILQRTANNQACVDNTSPIFVTLALAAECQGTAGGYTSFFGKGIVDALKAVTDGPGSGAADSPF